MKIRKVERMEAGTGEITMEYAEQTFKELLAFQGYGFCLGCDVPVVECERGEVPIGSLHVGDSVLTPGDAGGERWEQVLNVLPQGERETYAVRFSNGRTINMTLDHQLLCHDGVLRSTSDILDMYAEKQECTVMFRGMEQARISSVEYLGILPVIDITVSGRSHLFYANGAIVHNCKAHATSYSVYSAVQMWLQEWYFNEYMCALLNHVDRAKEKKGVGVLNERVEYCLKHGMTVLYPDVEKSSDKWELTNNILLAPLKNIKGFSDREVRTISENRPYADLKDFLDRTKLNRNRFEALLYAHAFDRWGTVEDLYNWYYNHYADQDGKPRKAKHEDQMTLDFGDFDAGDSSSGVAEVVRKFTKSEIDELCLDMNGFVIQENIQRKYHEFFERGMEKVAELKHNDSYNKPRRRIYKLSEIENEEPEEDKFKNRWVLAKIISEARDIPSKFGNKRFSKIVINDGYVSVTITSGRISQRFRKGRVMVFPVSIINGKVYLDEHTMDKQEPVVLEDDGE